MTTVAFVSAKGSPGVTTLACLLGAVWPPRRGVLVAECDPSGGDLAGRFGLSAKRGMASFVLARRRREKSDDDAEKHAQHLPGGLEVLVGPVGSDPAMALDHEMSMLDSPVFLAKHDVVIDCGRFNPRASGQHKMLGESDVVVVVARPDASSLAHGDWLIDRVGSMRTSKGAELVLVGTPCGAAPFSLREISETIGVEVLAHVPDDTRAAAIACGSPGRAKHLARSAVVAATRRIAHSILAPGSEGSLALEPMEGQGGLQ